MKGIHAKEWLKISAIVCFTLLALALHIAHQAPATGYELSIYSSTPSLVWFLLFISFIGGISIIIHQIATKEYRNSHYWLIGLLILIISRISLLYLPYIRGYISWRGDNITHLGLVKDVLSSGQFAIDNYYPVTHILLSQVISITGMPNITVVNLSTTMLSVIYLLSMYLLATAVFPYQGQQLMVLVLTGGVMIGGGYNVFLMPNGWSIFLLPLLFYIYFKHATPSYSVLFVIILILYPFFHPLSSLMVIISFVILELSRWLFPILFKYKTRISLPLNEKQPSATPALIEMVIFLPWVLSFQQFHWNIRLIWRQITTGVGPDVFSEIGNSLNKVNVFGKDFIILFIKMYGTTFIFIILAVAGVFFLWRQIRSGNIKSKRYNLFSLTWVFLLGGLFYIYYLLGGPGSTALAGGRILFYVEIFTPIFAAITLYELLRRLNFNYLSYAGIICLVVLTSALSIASLYYSPYIIQPNPQITQMDMTGITWFIEKKDRKIECANTLSNPGRLTQGILGSVEARKRKDINRYIPQIPDHFGYYEYNTLGDQYSEDKYITISQMDRLTYVTVWRQVGRFNESDFVRLEGDPTVNELYSNGELDVCYVISYQKTSLI
ncbi:MAG: hypothetical protein ACYC0Q_02290 [Eubacteriales bacterium]